MTPSTRLYFIVAAEPRSQGSMTAVYNRRLGCSRVRHANAPALSYWRNTVKANAHAAGAVNWGEGPIGIRVSFGIKAPLNTKHGYPKAPDLDKLIRAVLDALTGVCYKDDSQVTVIEADKSWLPHTSIEVWRIERQSKANQATLWAQDADRVESEK